MNFRIGDMVYSPNGVVIVVEYDDQKKKVSCISLCSRFGYEYDFEQIGLAFSETGHEVAVDAKYVDGDIVEFKFGTEVSTGIIQASDRDFFTIVKVVRGTFQTATAGVLIAKSAIIGHASGLTQSLLRLRWNDLVAERVVLSFNLAHSSAYSADYYLEEAWTHFQKYI
jgi:hypothetical protein